MAFPYREKTVLDKGRVAICAESRKSPAFRFRIGMSNGKAVPNATATEFPYLLPCGGYRKHAE